VSRRPLKQNAGTVHTALDIGPTDLLLAEEDVEAAAAAEEGAEAEAGEDAALEAASARRAKVRALSAIEDAGLEICVEEVVGRAVGVGVEDGAAGPGAEAAAGGREEEAEVDLSRLDFFLCFFFDFFSFLAFFSFFSFFLRLRSRSASESLLLLLLLLVLELRLRLRLRLRRRLGDFERDFRFSVNRWGLGFREAGECERERGWDRDLERERARGILSGSKVTSSIVHQRFYTVCIPI
jgi:hypothetical protein